MTRDPFVFISRVEPRVRYCRVLAGPKLCRTRFDVVIEFDAASHDVLSDDGTVIDSPTSSIPLDVFLIDSNGLPKIILLMTFIDMPVAMGLVMLRACTEPDTLTLL